MLRLEQCQQVITLGRLQMVVDKLKCSLDGIFG
ncbi:hypothetical protein DES53_103197 [Roseimicrobium gellanilyticum]|uniref:Uncharacterized protein n=1 Tax=Roseimicrobium gellanilyticum TaxID=748857 RepID=A0A366HQR9_9BACT|nr:hypothetical protein DES53_103197 [Roseimicrobium gellanilyticum]